MMNRFIIPIFVCAITLGACSFEPVYKDINQGGGTTHIGHYLENVEIEIIPNFEGQVVRNHLIDRFYKNGYPSMAEYRLVTAPIKETDSEIGIDKDDNASRAQLRQETSFRLIRIADNKTVLERKVRATTGYNILAGQFTTYITEADARKQALRTLADDIATQLELYFAQK